MPIPEKESGTGRAGEELGTGSMESKRRENEVWAARE